MLPDERKRRIVEILSTQGRVKVDDLSDMFNISKVTIRNDLRELEKEKPWIKRIYGGAVIQEGSKLEISFREKERKNIEEKVCIARKAVEFIRPGDSVIFDGGTTTLQIAKELKKASIEDVTVVTNSLFIAVELVDVPTVELIVTGGVKRENSYSLIGPLSEKVLSEVHVDKAFLGTTGFSKNCEFMTPSIMEAETKRRLMAVSDKHFIVTDSSKFDRVAFAVFARGDEIDYVLTDKGISEDVKRLLEENGIEVIIC